MSADDPNAHNYIFDPESTTELIRLINQGRRLTQGMNGPLSGIASPSSLQNILDIACGPGDWVLDTAFALPNAAVAGIDISQVMVRYAISRAQASRIHNASFEVMDIRQPLDFADGSFDLVNARLLVALLKREAYQQVIQDCFRLVRPGGIVRFTECDEGGRTNSAAYERTSLFASQAMHRLGYGFSPDGQTLGMSSALGDLLKNAGFQDVHMQAHSMIFSSWAEAHADLSQNSMALYLHAQPLFTKSGVATEEQVQENYQRMCLDLQSEQFSGTWTLYTALGRKPS